MGGGQPAIPRGWESPDNKKLYRKRRSVEKWTLVYYRLIFYDLAYAKTVCFRAGTGQAARTGALVERPSTSAEKDRCGNPKNYRKPSMKLPISLLKSPSFWRRFSTFLME